MQAVFLCRIVFRLKKCNVGREESKTAPQKCGAVFEKRRYRKAAFCPAWHCRRAEPSIAQIFDAPEHDFVELFCRKADRR